MEITWNAVAEQDGKLESAHPAASSWRARQRLLDRNERNQGRTSRAKFSGDVDVAARTRFWRSQSDAVRRNRVDLHKLSPVPYLTLHRELGYCCVEHREHLRLSNRDGDLVRQDDG